MEYRIDCPCGEHQIVRESAAGAVLTCACGNALHVPKLSQLRAIAGQPSDNVRPEVLIEWMLRAAQLPTCTTCAFCGGETAAIVIVHTDCSPRFHRVFEFLDFAKRVFEFVAKIVVRMVIALLSGLIFWSWESNNEERAPLKIYLLPIRVCPACTSALRDPAIIKRCMRKEPEYRRLLDKHPHAKIVLVS